MKLLLSILAPLLLLGGCGEGQRTQNTSGAVSQGKPSDRFQFSTSGTEADAHKLLVDLAASRGCEYVRDRVMFLSPGGAESDGESGLVSGVLWIRTCEITQVDPTHVEATLTGIGWRWVDRETDTAGATFELDQNVRFDMALSTTGSFDMAYDPEGHILTLGFAPTQPVEVRFTIRSELDVDAAGLWSSIVGTAADLTGQSPRQRAKEKVRTKGVQAVRSKLSQGFTVIWDLCSGRRNMKFGTKRAQTRPQTPAPSDAVNTRVTLHRNSMIMAGPFKEGARPAQFDAVEGGGFEAFWVCQDQAQQIAEQYVAQGQVGDIEPLGYRVIQQPETFAPPTGSDCPLVLITRPLAGATTPVSYRCRIPSETTGNGLLDCQ